MGMHEHRMITLILCNAAISVAIFAIYRDRANPKAQRWLGRLGVIWIVLYVFLILNAIARIMEVL